MIKAIRFVKSRRVAACGQFSVTMGLALGAGGSTSWADGCNVGGHWARNVSPIGTKKGHPATGDLSFASFLDILKYVAAKKGKTVHCIDRWYPSTKTCNCCGHINHNLTLSDRRWRCPSCNVVVDRDTNAALNILGEGTSSLAVGTVRPTPLASAV